MSYVRFKVPENPIRENVIKVLTTEMSKLNGEHASTACTRCGAYTCHLEFKTEEVLVLKDMCKECFDLSDDKVKQIQCSIQSESY